MKPRLGRYVHYQLVGDRRDYAYTNGMHEINRLEL